MSLTSDDGTPKHIPDGTVRLSSMLRPCKNNDRIIIVRDPRAVYTAHEEIKKKHLASASFIRADAHKRTFLRVSRKPQTRV